MSRIQRTTNFGIKESAIPLQTITSTPTYSDYVAQIEANKGPEINAFGSRLSAGLDAGPLSQSNNMQVASSGFGVYGGSKPSSTPNVAAIRATRFSADNAGPLVGTAPSFNFYQGSPERQRLTNVYRYVANYNKLEPDYLARGVSGAELLKLSPIGDGNNYFSDYVKGVPATVAPTNNSADTPTQPSAMLGASSQSTGNFLDNTPPQQGFSMGGLITQDQPMGAPMLANYATGSMIGQPPMGQQPAGLSPPMQGAQTGAPQGQPAPPMNPQMFDSHAADLLNQHPEIKQQIQQAVQQALASGQLTTQEAQLGVQLAQACINNPALWPQLRAFAIQNGLATEDQIPQQYDQGLVMAILIAAKAVQDPNNGGGPKGRFATGGLITGPGTGTSDSIPAVTDDGRIIRVSNDEFIIPAPIVKAKGTDFFNKMIESYNQDGSAATSK